MWSCQYHSFKTYKTRKQHQKLTEKFTVEQDTMQIDAPDFDPDIDGPNPQRVHHNTAVVSVQELFTSPEPESINATSTQEEAADSDQFNTGHSNLEDFHRPGSSPPPHNKFQTIHQMTVLPSKNRSPPYMTTFQMKFPIRRRLGEWSIQ